MSSDLHDVADMHAINVLPRALKSADLGRQNMNAGTFMGRTGSMRARIMELSACGGV